MIGNPLSAYRRFHSTETAVAKPPRSAVFHFVYMADLADWVAKYGVSLHAYADDTQLYLHFCRNEIVPSVD